VGIDRRLTLNPLAPLLTDQWKQTRPQLARVMKTQVGANGTGNCGGFSGQNALVLLRSVNRAFNVVSAGEVAGEAARIGTTHRPPPERDELGLYPSRYQSDEVDRKQRHGLKACNRRPASGFASWSPKISSNVTLTIVGLPAVWEDQRLPPVDQQCGSPNPFLSDGFSQVVKRFVSYGVAKV